ncbi:MAG: hypothetical protein A3H50_00280 [Candidatus Levybacteria bacterium RIFCSPLOWO2_02_FULL_37_10]|nr:MAG: hypothetical protein A2860_03800 [Candidatus Levybacteria bacterium RIFCSPHIGHO2_01_FULL_37_33]OGH15607.1 MAG: hypothetical protein A3C97_01555 [Candidatus Levybacteria bacterium RIFCSPHIGHO2_02_FULL_37_11]OGH30116.1 MAG: hypothetical protein A3F30_01845 [Candidatus Levybacteria bacterium RIFCSPHIGHO2_12_FULL_37_12]OGH32368.1 MAG: hypothetical protein A2953_01840 [Candidatus Levybacteria bacterium RIFCSPLOWO2_01_FULL_36_54]OGH46310.1 MAG: hypothetical protein A3H50_00280 [Candidatus Lev
MKKLFIIANWKSNKTIEEAEQWFHDFAEKLKSDSSNIENKEIIVCPSFILFEHARYCSNNLKLPIRFGAQNISPFDKGAYTGEVNGEQIKEFAQYVIIGHSERRKNFSETNEMLKQKVLMAKKYNLMPIFCIQNQDSPVPQEIDVIAYEPPTAIGTGNPDTPENAQRVAKIVKERTGVANVLYGGSVTSSNVKTFTNMPDIDGLLVGGASLDSLEFLAIIKNA